VCLHLQKGKVSKGINQLGTIWLSLTLVLLSACGGQQSQKGDQKAAGQQGQRGGRGPGGPESGSRGQSISGVKLVSVERKNFQRQVDLSGTLMSLDQAHVSSEVDGIVRDVFIEIGHEVKAGQVLVQIDTRELQFALDRAESALRQNEAQIGIVDASTELPPDDEISSVRTAAASLQDAKNNLARAQSLNARGLVSKADLDTLATRLKVADAQYGAAIDAVHATKATLQDRRAAYELAKKKLADAQIRAPVSGMISERLVQRGEFLRANTQVATIVEVLSLKLKSAVQEKYAGLIRGELPVTFNVEPYPNQTFTGKIAYISPATDQTTRTFAVEVLVDNSSRKLRPGFFAQGKILTKMDADVLAVHEDAVAMLAGIASVYVVNNGVAKQTNIQVGDRAGDFLEVVAGLNGNETLAASNLNQLVSGMTVNPGGGEGRGRREAGGQSTQDRDSGSRGRAQGASQR
jgi:RND family efflux transporter MFP subunit